MALISGEAIETVKYNSTEHFYYLTEAGMIKYTGYDYLVDIWNNPKAKLEKMGRKLHSLYTDSVHNNKRKYFKHKDLIHYKIFNDDFDESQAIINALALMIEFEEDQPSWFKKLLANEIKWPMSIINILKQANVYVVGEMSGSVPEDEWQVGY